MFDELDEIILNKPLEEATFLDFCQGTPRQRSLKAMKEASLYELKANIGDDALWVYEALQNSKKGYMRIRRQWPSRGEPHEGWTYIFAAGLPLFLDRPDEWYHTSNIKKIDRDGRTFETLHSIYSFEFLRKTDAGTSCVTGAENAP